MRTATNPPFLLANHTSPTRKRGIVRPSLARRVSFPSRKRALYELSRRRLPFLLAFLLPFLCPFLGALAMPRADLGLRHLGARCKRPHLAHAGEHLEPLPHAHLGH